MIKVTPAHLPELDPDFVPASLWNKSYRALAAATAGSRAVTLQLIRPDGRGHALHLSVLPDAPEYRADNALYCERIVKMMLWAWGGAHLRINGAPDIAAHLRQAYCPGGEREFDYTFMGKKVFLQTFTIDEEPAGQLVADPESKPLGKTGGGCRIGFDLGGSDRKCAALIDGEVVFTEEVKWSPYFESDPAVHIAGIQDSIERAARHLPRVDAIGGSVAGIYIDNEPRVASLFRGVSDQNFDAQIRPLFRRLQERWGNVPLVLANDGDVTALAGAQALGETRVLGLSMGTSQAVGYVNAAGGITGWLNELAFAPIDYRGGAPADEWSGDCGCGVQYFSQQGVSRLLPASGLPVSTEIPMPEQLEAVQAYMAQGDERAAAIYRTIGVCLGYALAHYADFYDYGHLLFLGRVSSGAGGEIIRTQAEAVLRDEFPQLAQSLRIELPDETMKRHGQAVAAAFLPEL